MRVSKPGAHMLAFGGTRTHHRLMVAIEDAGWEIRDTLMWVYGSGFPKSLNTQQAINKAANGYPQGGPDPTSPNHGKFKGGCCEESPNGKGFGAGAGAFMKEFSGGRKDDEGDWHGWGTALKPAWEPIVLARKPLEGTVAQNVLKWGCGGINIDGCRVESPKDDKWYNANYPHKTTGYDASGYKIDYQRETMSNDKGRWPANFLHDGSEEVVELFPQSSTTGKRVTPHQKSPAKNTPFTMGNPLSEYTDSGSAARFFYCAKASHSERGEGNNHPTVKPIALLRYLCKLITPPHGIVLDPFGGSGSTGVAAKREGFDCVMIELEKEYCNIATQRLAKV